jgi:hypothetical protein
MDTYIHQQNLALLKRRLAETQDEKQRAIILTLLVEEEARGVRPLCGSPRPPGH